MPRRKQISGKQHKADLQQKRAIKRGDPQVLEHDGSHKLKTKSRTGPTVGSSKSNQDAVESSRRLQSSFIKFSSQFLAEAKELASTLPLPRPIPFEVSTFNDAIVNVPDDRDALKVAAAVLSCPKRPKWRYGMTKKEVEKNEEGVYKKWLNQTDHLVHEWRAYGESKGTGEDGQGPEAEEPIKRSEMPRSTPYFERNLEVWRQLWRVTEVSQIIMVLLDSRCPLIHFPPSLASYLVPYTTGTSRTGSKKLVVVLTKVDLSGTARACAWETYFLKRYPSLKVLQIESYYSDSDASNEDRPVNSGHRIKKDASRLSHDIRHRLLLVLKDVHAELLDPPESVSASEEKLRRWKPPVKQDIDWQAMSTGVSMLTKQEQSEDTTSRNSSEDGDPESERYDDERDSEPAYLTVALIGQPNVGKSSLINALFGESKVRASKTPGKTKHFQTLFLTPEIRFVDCPGLVMPNFVPMELQVLSGIIPISVVSSIPSCIHHIACLLPLEQIFNLTHPNSVSSPTADKRTWREGMRLLTVDSLRATEWTAMDILTAYANAKKWVTAKAGRPDVMRAGNAILRHLAEGRVLWAFWPPGSDPSIMTEAQSEAQPGAGIWIRREHIGMASGASDSESEESDESGSKADPESTRKKYLRSDSDSDSDSNSTTQTTDVAADLEDPSVTTQPRVQLGRSNRFGMLALGDEEEEGSAE